MYLRMEIAPQRLSAKGDYFMNTEAMNKENDYGNMKLAVKLHDI